MQRCELILDMFGKNYLDTPIFSLSEPHGTIWRMPDHVDENILLGELYPGLSEAERMEIKEFLDAYCAIIVRMCEREEREREESFDGPLSAR